jgi:putative endonuclease
MYYVYIVTNLKKKVLYVGVTNDLQMRVAEHFRRRGDMRTFTGKYHCFNLIYYEQYISVSDAIAREKAIKNRSRAWKESLIGKVNPKWNFLNEAMFDPWPPDVNFFR